MMQWTHSLVFRFFIWFILLAVLPVTIACHWFYVNTVQSMQKEMLNMRMETAYADRFYLQNQLDDVESVYYQYKNSTSLNGIIDLTYVTYKNIMYQYKLELAQMMKESKYSSDYISDIRVYSRNRAAAEILPHFYTIDKLDTSEFPHAYQENASSALYQHFWYIDIADGEPRLVFCAGLTNLLRNTTSGVLMIICNDSMLEHFIPEQDDGALYLCKDGMMQYAYGANDSYDKLAQTQMDALSDDIDADVKYDAETNTVIITIQLSDQGLCLMQITPYPNVVSLPRSFWVIVLLCTLSSLILFFVLLKPLRNITLLARHMQSAQPDTLSPYMGKAGTSEIAFLIYEYNALIDRVNRLSESVYQNKIQLRTAQIERLQSQLNPHFFYGTLEIIRMTAVLNNQQEIADIAYDFSDLMRYSLSGKFFVPLQREYEIVNQYLSIQKKRLGDRFQVTWDNMSDMPAWKCPKFVLFSMVENVFSHDVSNTRKCVHITIKIREYGDLLSIAVSNDGPGVEPERLKLLKHLINHPEDRQKMSSCHNGRSIFNINDRLHFYYGEDYSFEIDSVPNVLTTCSVRINRNARFMGEENDQIC